MLGKTLKQGGMELGCLGDRPTLRILFFWAQPFSPFPPQCYSTLARRHSSEWPFSWEATCGYLKNPKDEGK